MKIELTITLPIDPLHGMDKGTRHDVLRRGKRGYWVQGLDKEVLVLRRECKQVQETS